MQVTRILPQTSFSLPRCFSLGVDVLFGGLLDVNSGDDTFPFQSFQLLVGHVWRVACSCLALVNLNPRQSPGGESRRAGRYGAKSRHTLSSFNRLQGKKTKGRHDVTNDELLVVTYERGERRGSMQSSSRLGTNRWEPRSLSSRVHSPAPESPKTITSTFAGSNVMGRFYGEVRSSRSTTLAVS